MLRITLVISLFAITFAAKFDLPPEWHAWKATHNKNYENDHEELSRHVIWVSNQKYIDEHNKYTDTFGYTLEMNRFGDLVRIA